MTEEIGFDPIHEEVATILGIDLRGIISCAGASNENPLHFCHPVYYHVPA
jgi:hypothetical protein